MLIGLLWLILFIDWIANRPIYTSDLALLGVIIVISAGLLRTCMPIWRIPTHRVTIAGDAMLAMNQFYGQLRAMPVPSHKPNSRVFSVVRHWAICPICSAEVDLAWGGAAFPDRIVGRCHDSPLEHVFSFDPVRLVGAPLRA